MILQLDHFIFLESSLLPSNHLRYQTFGLADYMAFTYIRNPSSPNPEHYVRFSI